MEVVSRWGLLESIGAEMGSQPNSGTHAVAKTTPSCLITYAVVEYHSKHATHSLLSLSATIGTKTKTGAMTMTVEGERLVAALGHGGLGFDTTDLVR
jgi:hypothetical protein